jgi:hypothetical protein
MTDPVFSVDLLSDFSPATELMHASDCEHTLGFVTRPIFFVLFLAGCARGSEGEQAPSGPSLVTLSSAEAPLLDPPASLEELNALLTAVYPYHSPSHYHTLARVWGAANLARALPDQEAWADELEAALRDQATLLLSRPTAPGWHPVSSNPVKDCDPPS